MAQAHYLDKKAAACVEASQRAFAYACESGDGFEKREVVEWLLVAHEFGPTPAQDAIDALQKLMTRIRPDPLLEGLVSSTIALFEAMRGHVDRAEQLLAEGRNMIEDQTELIPLLLWNTGLIRLGVGQEFDLAEAELRNGYETLSAMGRTGHFSAFCVLLAQVCYETGRYEEASSYVREAAAAARPNDVHDQVSWRATEAKLLARAGRTAEAEQLAREGVALAEEGDFLLSHSEALSALSEVLRLAGRPNDAQVPLEEALSLHERKGNVVAVAQTRKRLDAL